MSSPKRLATVNDYIAKWAPEETRKAVSAEGILYTGDPGYFKQMDGYSALYPASRKGISLDPRRQDRQNRTDIIGGRDSERSEAEWKMGYGAAGSLMTST